MNLQNGLTKFSADTGGDPLTAIFKDMMKGLDEVESFLSGERAGFKVRVPAQVDVKAIRQRLNMTQARFSDTFGFSLDAVKHWEGGRRTPESSARAFLTVIARNPGAVIEALYQDRREKHSDRKRTIVTTKVRTAHRAGS